VANIARWERLGRWFMTAWVLFAVPSAVAVLLAGLKPAQLSMAAGFAAWGIVWAWLWLRVIGRDHSGEVVGLLALTILLVIFTLMAPSPGTGFLVFAFIVAGIVFPVRQALWVFLGLAVVQVVLGILRLADPATILNQLINSVLIGFLGIGARLFWQSYIQLMSAREQLAHLAVTEERLRFARDLHDLLGQSLSVLVLKSELVAKQLPEDADESLRGEVRDISQVARKSLNDVREAVAGYRRPTLEAEITSARSALRAAGIGLLVEDTVGVLPAEQDGVLAWCLREAVTNVVKHSGAKRCEVRIFRSEDSANLEVADDGRGAASLNGGSGLAGMQERVALVGGTVKVGAENGGGLQLRVSLPQPA
jgi:two-component system sensor histidine kinase DesK